MAHPPLRPRLLSTRRLRFTSSFQRGAPLATWQGRYTASAAVVLASRERANLAAADAVVCLTAADCALLRAEAAGALAERAFAVARWGHALGGKPRVGTPGLSGASGVVRAGDIPAGWAGRSNLLFVGFADNPTNALGLAWFFHAVWPLLPPALHKQRLLLATGGAPRPVRTGGSTLGTAMRRAAAAARPRPHCEWLGAVSDDRLAVLLRYAPARPHAPALAAQQNSARSAAVLLAR